MTPSTEPLFGVIIEDCYVLGWKLSHSDFRIDLELSLHPGNPHFSKPQKGEWACYKPGHFLLMNCQIIEANSMSDFPINIDPDGSLDYGSLDSAAISGGYIEVWGPFGGVRSEPTDFSYTVDV